MARVAVFLDHDILVRHFAISGALAPLADKHEVVYVFPEDHKRVRYDISALPIKRYRTIPISRERVFLYRRLYHATVLRQLRGTRDEAILFQFWRDTLGLAGFLESWLYSWPLTYPYYRSRMLSQIGENEELDRLLAEEAPDIILHPTVLEGLFVSDLVQWGRKHGTPTVFIMNSWDNPSVKAMLVGHPDHLVVWGEQTRRHAIQYLKVPYERITCLGAAQFDLYRRPPKVDPSEYRRRLGISDGWKVLLYAGSSKGLNEIRHLMALERAVAGGELKNCMILYRPHPWRAYPEEEADFFSVDWKHVLLDPVMADCYRLSRQKTRIHIELADYTDTHVTLNAVDAVISPLSTILLEAALHGKPVAAYLPEDNLKTNKFLATVARLDHFQDFFDRIDCIKCESPDHLIADCRRLLDKTDDPGIGEKLKAQCSYFIEPSDRSYAERLNGLIHSLVIRAKRNPNIPEQSS